MCYPARGETSHSRWLLIPNHDTNKVNLLVGLSEMVPMHSRPEDLLLTNMLALVNLMISDTS